CVHLDASACSHVAHRGRWSRCLSLYWSPDRCCHAFFFFNDSATPGIYPLSLHDALPISSRWRGPGPCRGGSRRSKRGESSRTSRSEEHTSELQSLRHLVCRLLLEKKNQHQNNQQQQRPPLAHPALQSYHAARQCRVHVYR